MSKEDKGKYVSRAAFAKMQGERDRLKKDLYVIVMGDMFQAIEVRAKWKKVFEGDKELWDLIREAAKLEPSKNKQP